MSFFINSVSSSFPFPSKKRVQQRRNTNKGTLKQVRDNKKKRGDTTKRALKKNNKKKGYIRGVKKKRILKGYVVSLLLF